MIAPFFLLALGATDFALGFASFFAGLGFSGFAESVSASLSSASSLVNGAVREILGIGFPGVIGGGRRGISGPSDMRSPCRTRDDAPKTDVSRAGRADLLSPEYRSPRRRARGGLRHVAHEHPVAR